MHIQVEFTLFPAETTSILGSVSAAFFGAAIPEEIAKFIMLWILLRKNRYFDEKMDGIVYAVCVSHGFAATKCGNMEIKEYKGF